MNFIVIIIFLFICVFLLIFFLIKTYKKIQIQEIKYKILKNKYDNFIKEIDEIRKIENSKGKLNDKEIDSVANNINWMR